MPAAPDFQFGSYGGYPPMYVDPAVPLSNYQNVYNDIAPANQPLVPYQGIDNSGYEVNNQYENIPMDGMADAGSARDTLANWDPVNLAKLYPQLYYTPTGTLSNLPKSTSNQLLKNSGKNSEEPEENFINFDTIPIQRATDNRTKEDRAFNKETLRNILRQLSKAGKETDPRNGSDYRLYTNAGDTYFDKDKRPKDGINKKRPKEIRVGMVNEESRTKNLSALNSLNVESKTLPLPEKLVNKKSAQMKALQNLSKLKAMIHIAKEERRTVQHKREEARRQFLSEVAEELQLMSSAKLAEIEASKSYRALSAAEKALANKDRDIHSLLEKEDSLYEDLTDAEASLAKADMDFIPKIKSEEELRQFASFLNFGF